MFFFFFQAEDGIRDLTVTGVQTCALPISLRLRTTQTLRTAILDGVFAPGQKLSERELCESLDVSRSCLRESLQHLQAEGLITIVPHRGPEVTDISVQEVDRKSTRLNSSHSQ